MTLCVGLGVSVLSRLRMQFAWLNGCVGACVRCEKYGTKVKFGRVLVKVLNLDLHSRLVLSWVLNSNAILSLCLCTRFLSIGSTVWHGAILALALTSRQCVPVLVLRR